MFFWDIAASCVLPSSVFSAATQQFPLPIAVYVAATHCTCHWCCYCCVRRPGVCIRKASQQKLRMHACCMPYSSQSNRIVSTFSTVSTIESDHRDISHLCIADKKRGLRFKWTWGYPETASELSIFAYCGGIIVVLFYSHGELLGLGLGHGG